MTTVAQSSQEFTHAAPPQLVTDTKVPKYGTRQDVWEGKALMTKGKLTKEDLTLNSRGLACSKKSQERGKALQKQIAERGPKPVVATEPKEPQLVAVAVEKTKKGRGRPAKKEQEVPM